MMWLGGPEASQAGAVRVVTEPGKRGGLGGRVVKWRHSCGIPRGAMIGLWEGKRVAGPWR